MLKMRLMVNLHVQTQRSSMNIFTTVKSKSISSATISSSMSQILMHLFMDWLRTCSDTIVLCQAIKSTPLRPIWLLTQPSLWTISGLSSSPYRQRRTTSWLWTTLRLCWIMLIMMKTLGSNSPWKELASILLTDAQSTLYLSSWEILEAWTMPWQS